MTHLGPRISALVDGELGHEARDRALAHVAHCASCQELLDGERAVKEALASAGAPRPPERVLASLHALGLPGGPLPPRARSMPQGPVVPVLPPPGRSPRRARTPRGRRPESRGPARAGTAQRSSRVSRRARYAAVGSLSLAGLVLGLAFAAGAPPTAGSPVVPPAAELSVEHAATVTGVTFGDPGLGVAATFGDASLPTAPRR